MGDFLQRMFATDFLPHGYCMRWASEVVWLHVISDALTALAYYVIPFGLLYFVRRRKDLAFSWMFVCFGIFILACGTTHVMGIWTLWQPVYRLDGVVKAVTALASVPTAFLLLRLMPRALALPSPAQLRQEVADRRAVEEQVRQLNAELEQRVRDRTAELQAINRQLQDSEQRFRATFEQAAVGIAHVSAEGRWLRVNKRLCELVGYSSAELLELTFSDITHAEDRKADWDKAQALLRGEITTYSMEKRYFHKNGAIIWVNLTASLVRHPDGSPNYFISVIEDIRERKQAEEVLLRQSKELTRSNVELQQFAYITSHDLREPLRGVVSFSELLRLRYQGQLDADADQYISYLVEAATRMDHLIGDLLRYSRLAADETAVRRSVPLTDVVQTALKNLVIAVKESGAEIVCEPLPVVVADERSNWSSCFKTSSAMRSSTGRSRPPLIRVRAEQWNGEWVITVEDNGIGIHASDQEWIFGFFKRLSRHTMGTGMGLAICKKIVEKHGGRIWVQSEPGAGASFYVSLPVVQMEYVDNVDNGVVFRDAV